MLKILKNYNLNKLNTFNVPVFSKFFVEIKSEKELEELFLLKEFQNNKFLFLGSGSNILFLNNWPGIVVLNRIKGIKIIKENNDYVYIKAMGGELWHSLVEFSVERNYWGIENMASIPGTVGASPVQNIGAYGRELKDVLEEIEVYDIEKSKKKLTKKIFKNKECKFNYRDSVFKNKFKNKYFILSITIKLSKKENKNANYIALENYIKENNIKIKRSKDISDIVSIIRKSKLPNPKKVGNAGSFFKNVYINSNKLNKLLKKYPKMPYFNENGRIKIPTAWLIESCDFKGKTYGAVGVHSKQALILVHYGGGRGKDIHNLAKKIISKVYLKFGIKISPEVNLI